MPPRPAADAASGPALRVLAHPLRSRLAAHLRVHGPATASELARALDSNSGATSYHLRRLAEVGLIEDTETSTGRRRVWQAGPDLMTGPGPEPTRGGGGLDEDEHAASRWLAVDYVEHFSQRARGWVSDQDAWPPAWSVAGLEDHLVQVSAEQLTALRAELVEVLQRYRRVGQGNPAAKRVVVYTCALPVDPPPPQP